MPGQDAALTQLTAKVQDHSSVLQAVQVDLRHVVKAIEHLVGVSEKQAVLGAQLERHSDSIDRAFRHMDGVETRLAQSIKELAEVLKKDRESAGSVAETVQSFRGSVRALQWVSGGIWGLLVIIGAMYANGVEKSFIRMETDMTALKTGIDTRKSAVDIKIDALSQQVQEVRLDRQRDQEAKAQP